MDLINNQSLCLGGFFSTYNILCYMIPWHGSDSSCVNLIALIYYKIMHYSRVFLVDDVVNRQETLYFGAFLLLLYTKHFYLIKNIPFNSIFEGYVPKNCIYSLNNS